MINSIVIENFLSHKDTFIKLDPGVNVFLGESDVGKSAIFRAINKIVSNRPMGTDFIRWGQNNCYIGIELSEDIFVEWSYENGQAKYVLCQENDEQVFKAFNKSVPDEILTSLNIQEINFQHQLTNAFLFQSSSGEVARYLNQIVNLDVIDNTLYNINHRLKGEQVQLAGSNASQKRIEEGLKQYDWLDEAENKLDIAIQLEDDLNSLKSSVLELTDAINSITLIEERSFKYKRIIAFEAQINSLLELDKEIEDFITDYDALQGYIDNIIKCESSIKKANDIIKAEPILLKIEKIDSELSKLIDNEKELEYLFDNLVGLETRINKLQKTKDDLENRLHESMPDVCPLCDQEIKK